MTILLLDKAQAIKLSVVLIAKSLITSVLERVMVYLIFELV